MYKVELLHHRKAWYHGDVCSEDIIERVEVFKTRKEAKNWILQKAPSKAKQEWHVGDKASWVYWDTDKQWFNERTGEDEIETYTYKLTKESSKKRK